MRRVFADAFSWVAICNRRDQWHSRVAKLSQTLSGCELVTTDEILIEFLAHFSAAGSTARQQVARFVRDLLDDPSIRVCSQSRQSFLHGLALYESRLDKQYSLTDCIAMAVMRQEAITEVLSHDQHFTQEGFKLLS